MRGKHVLILGSFGVAGYPSLGFRCSGLAFSRGFPLCGFLDGFVALRLRYAPIRVLQVFLRPSKAFFRGASSRAA